MARPSKYVLVYDVTEDAERTRLAKIVEGFGIRVQKSAFECHLTKGARATLERKLGELKLKTGHVFLYRVDARAKRLAIGAVPPNPLDDANYAFVVGCASPRYPRHETEASPHAPTTGGGSSAGPDGVGVQGSRGNSDH